MSSSLRLIGILLLLVSLTNLGISIQLTGFDEKLSVILSALVIFIAGIFLYRGYRLWPILGLLSSLLYCYLVAFASTSMLFHGMFVAWWSALVYPAHDPSIWWVSKAFLLYFQGLLPILFLTFGTFSLLALLIPLVASNGKLRA
jgi:hypothetical protein